MISFHWCIWTVVLCLLLPVTYANVLQANEDQTVQRLKRAPKGHLMKIKFNLATSFGNLDASSLKNLDDALKIVIGGIHRMDFKQKYTWPELMTKLEKCPYLARNKKKATFNVKKIDFRDTKVFGYGSDKSNRVKVIESWFATLIGNADILKDSKIQLKKVAQMVANSDVSMWKNLFSGQVRTVSLMDAGILRFPDFTRPFFALYRINLVAKVSYESSLFTQKEHSAILGTFQREVFVPNKEYISSLTENFMEQLMSEVDDLFS